ncbi:MAG: hypothetical protein K6E29_02420 [Cyanobacteria bacterium RUI128]|nr:hypothetical protein [Cyanobacteria bacterium RUI128]
MAKNTKTIFEIFLQGVGLYATNIDRFVRYMLFPVLGQLAGLVLTTIIVYSFCEYKTVILSNVPILKNQLYMNIALGVILLPVIALWLKSIWDYIVAYAAVNSMTENMLKSQRVYDIPAHTMMVTRRPMSYIGLWILYSGIILLSFVPIFTVFCWILLIYYAFVFQIFIFEPELTPVECFKKSSYYVRGSFGQTMLMIALIGGLTYIIFPQILLAFLDTVKAVVSLRDLILPYISVPSLDWINMVLSAMGLKQIMPLQVSLFIVQFLIWIVIIQMLLPLRVICLCLWYKNFHNDAGAMKQIDDRILERAGAKKSQRRKK